VNDSRGHAAGDRLLRDLVRALRAQLCDHDLVIRYGGDEFVCAVSGLDLVAATKRFTRIGGALAAFDATASVTIGIAELRSTDSLADLVARADAALYAERAHRRARKPSS
jgi:diguanylate cyclase (GGDEF)-like protein